VGADGELRARPAPHPGFVAARMAAAESPIGPTRFSTARHASPGAVMRQLCDHLGTGVILNLGSGHAPSWERDDRRKYIHCDLVTLGTGDGPFVVADAVRLPFRRASFAGALAKDVLEHVDDVLSALTELRAVVRPGGRLVLTVPRAVPRAVWADVTHKRGFTGRALEEALALTGWRIQKRCRIGSIPGIQRLGLEHRLLDLLRIPGLGHRFGTNWLVVAQHPLVGA